MVWCSGALSSDQRVLLTQRPCGVWERSCSFHSSRRTWSVAREPSRQTWNGSKQISAWGTAARIARWYSPLMSIETARIEFLRGPSSAKNSAKVALLRPARHHTIAPERWSATEVRYGSPVCRRGVGGRRRRDQQRQQQVLLEPVAAHHGDPRG